MAKLSVQLAGAALRSAVAELWATVDAHHLFPFGLSAQFAPAFVRRQIENFHSIPLDVELSDRDYEVFSRTLDKLQGNPFFSTVLKEELQTLEVRRYVLRRPIQVTCDTDCIGPKDIRPVIDHVIDKVSCEGANAVIVDLTRARRIMDDAVPDLIRIESLRKKTGVFLVLAIRSDLNQRISRLVPRSEVVPAQETIEDCQKLLRFRESREYATGDGL